MDRQAFLTRLAVITAVFAGLALLFCVIFGEQAFSFYGFAAAGILVLPFLAKTLIQRAKHTGRSRWPAVAIVTVLALAAFAQIGFWMAFFFGGDTGMSLGLMRSLLGTVTDSYEVAAGVALGGVLLWIIGHLSR